MTENPSEKVVMILTAAGSGKRMGADMPKQFLELGGRPLFIHPLTVLELCPAVHGVVVVVPGEHVEAVAEILARVGFTKVLSVVAGGLERQDSVALGLEAVPADATFIGVHDGVRALITDELIQRLVDVARTHGAAIPGVPVTDTIKRVDGPFIGETVDRSTLTRVQTPQVFRADWLREAYDRAHAQGLRVTDDASLVEQCGHRVRLVEGDEENIKITHPQDLALARMILERRK